MTGVSAQLSSGARKAFDQSVDRAQSLLARYDGGGVLENGGAESEDAVGPDAPLMALLRLTLGQVAAVVGSRRTADGAER